MNSRPPNTGKQGNVADHTDNENRTLMNSDSMVNRSSLPRSGEGTSIVHLFIQFYLIF